MSIYYNENGDLQGLDSWADVVMCDNCCTPYRQEREEQPSGFREMSEDGCPYCGHVHSKSMDVDYYNYRMSDIDIDKYMQQNKFAI